MAGIDIQNGIISLMGDRVIFSNSTGSVIDKVYIDPDDGTIHAVDGDFSGKITATSGQIGGFTIDSNRLYNSDWNAGIDITYGGRNVKIGKNAEGVMSAEKAIIRAENTEIKSSTTDTYNTAIYVNANNARYNYAFYGNGNGVLNGYIQGFKVKVLEQIGARTNLLLRDGMVQVVASVGIAAAKYLYLPTLGEIRRTLGIAVGDNNTNFTCRLILINKSNMQTTSLNRNNVYVYGDTHGYSDQITSEGARPVILRQSDEKYCVLEPAWTVDFNINYIDRRFIANFIEG